MGQAAHRLADHATGRTTAYVAAVACAAFLTASALIASGYNIDAPVAVIALAVAAAVAERTGVRLTGNTELSISGLPAIFAAVVFGPLAAGLVGAASMLGDPE